MKNGQVMDIGQASKTAIQLPTSSFTSPSKSVARSRPEHHYCSKSADHYSLKKSSGNRYDLLYANKSNFKANKVDVRESCKRVLFANDDEDEEETEENQELLKVKSLAI